MLENKKVNSTMNNVLPETRQRDVHQQSLMVAYRLTHDQLYLLSSLNPTPCETAKKQLKYQRNSHWNYRRHGNYHVSSCNLNDSRLEKRREHYNKEHNWDVRIMHRCPKTCEQTSM